MPVNKVARAPRSPVVAVSRELPVRPASRRARSDSSRSVASTVTLGKRAEQVQGVVPLVRVDYGQGYEVSRSPSLPNDPHQQDEGGRAFMESSIGTQLRASERAYVHTTRQVVASMKSIRGSRVLVLGCGASRHLLRLALDGPQSIVFVDTSQPALNRIERLMVDGGYSDVIDAEYICFDAWSYVTSGAAPPADIVLVTKCLGQVFKTDPCGRSVGGLLDGLTAVVPEDGLVVVDHHDFFASFEHGALVTSVVPRGQRDVATIGGRFVDDVCYSSMVGHGEFDLVLSWNADANRGGIQSWTQFIYRRRVAPPPVVMRVAEPLHDVVPVPFRLGESQDLLPGLACLVPRTFNGVKRIPAPSDVRGIVFDNAVPKFDGRAGVVVIGGSRAAFVSTTHRLAFSLSRVYTSRMLLAAELVSVDSMRAVIVVVGAICVADVECDPYSVRDLDAVRSLLRPLAADGIVVTTSTMCSSISSDAFVRLGPITGRHVRLPVDGINCTIGGRNGVFLKPADMCTVDATIEEVEVLLRNACRAGGLSAPKVDFGGFELTPPTTVVEFFLSDPVANIWSAVKDRADKTVSNTLGRTIVDVVAAMRTYDLLGGPGIMPLISKFT